MGGRFPFPFSRGSQKAPFCIPRWASLLPLSLTFSFLPSPNSGRRSPSSLNCHRVDAVFFPFPFFSQLDTLLPRKSSSSSLPDTTIFFRWPANLFSFLRSPAALLFFPRMFFQVMRKDPPTHRVPEAPSPSRMYTIFTCHSTQG